MKQKLRILFSPVLNIFESGSEAFSYKTSHRIILMIMGGLFSSLATLVFFFALGEDPGYFIPVIVFGTIGLLSLLIAILGSDRAVAKIWSSARR